jgi:hypothetical protein
MNIGKHIRMKTVKTGSNAVIPTHPIIREIQSLFDLVDEVK